VIQAKVIADSISEGGVRITTLQLVYPRFIHAEFMTHRVFSRNASSSRAIPVKKMLKDIWSNPAMPVHWGSNKPGMQAGEELKGFKLYMAKSLWKAASKAACVYAWSMMRLGVHKQVSNRVLEPFQHIHVIVTATEWDNFFDLRAHEAAQPEIQELAYTILGAMESSTPQRLKEYHWHLPYLSKDEINTFKWTGQMDTALKISAARCARVSYMKHDGTAPSVKDDLELYGQLMIRPFTDKRGTVYGEDSPIHASPVEHQARPAESRDEWSGNFRGWIQNRKLIERKLDV